MKINAERVTAAELQPGDLFSFYEPEYWSGRDGVPPHHTLSIGERTYIAITECFIRGSAKTPPGDEAATVTRLVVEP